MFSSKYFSKKYFTGAYYPPASEGSLYAYFDGTSEFSAQISDTGVPQQPTLILGNLGFRESFWPQSDIPKEEIETSVKHITAEVRCLSDFEASGYLKKKTPNYDIVNEIIRKYEAEVEQLREADDEEAMLALMEWW